MSQGFTRGVPIDNDVNMAANSPLLVPSQYAVVQYVAGQIASISGVASVSASAPMSSSGGANPNISMTQASASTDGWISASDYTEFKSISKGFIIAMAVAL